jgi:hypothetical protein
VQDNWRVRNNLTLNAGLRYELQQPFVSRNDSYSTATLADICGISGIGADGQCNLFKPGTQTGRAPFYVNYTAGTPAFKTDKNNFAPSLGLTYRPVFQDGILRKMFGEDGDSVLFGSYALAYERAGMADFSDVFGDNPGVSIAVNRNATLGNLNNDGRGLPVLFRDTGRLGPPPFATSQQYPLPATLSDTVHIFNPDLQVPYAQTWTGGIRRKIVSDIGLEVRYVGTRHLQGWGEFDINETDIVSNGFANEFRQAQANLRANIAAGPGAGCIGGVTTAGCQNNFAFTGAPGTGPLPIYLAYFTGTPLAQAGNTGRYTGGSWSDTNFTNPLAIYNPNPFTPAGTNANSGLEGDAQRRANAAAAGLPRNLFRANPDVNEAIIESNTGYQRYDALQMDLTKRLSHGFLMQANYTFGKAYTSSRYSLRAPRIRTLPGWRLGNRRRCPHPERSFARFRQRAHGGHVAQGSPEVGRHPGVRADGHQRERAGQHLPPAAGHHGEHNPRLQRVGDFPVRVRQPRRAERAVPRARERAGLHGDDRRRSRHLRSAHPRRDRTDVLALGHQRGEAHASRRPDDVRVPRRPDQRVQPRQLHARDLDV